MILNDIVIVDIQAMLTAVGGGLIMAYVMFKMLPGMRDDAYPPSDWVPVAAVLIVAGWFTYFLPHYLVDEIVANTGQEEGIVVTMAFFILYMITLITTLYVLQRLRRNRDS